MISLSSKLLSKAGKWFALLLVLGSSLFLEAQDIPKATGFVMDQAGLFTPEERSSLENALQALNDSTSNQIAIYTTLDLQGYDKSDVALKYLRENAVGQAKSNNGVVILIKPKTDESKGEAFIEVGYGLEGAIPDAIAKRVIENEMIPAFKQGNYYAGTTAAVVTLSQLASGEIKAANYSKRAKGNTPAGVIIVLIIGIFIFVALSGNRRYAGRNNLPFWVALGLFNSIGSRHNGSWNDFSGGSGGGGGFGGFGGGSGGGGGAGGSW